MTHCPTPDETSPLPHETRRAVNLIVIAAVIRDAMRHNLTHWVQQFRTLSVQMVPVLLSLSSVPARVVNTGCAFRMNEQKFSSAIAWRLFTSVAIVRNLAMQYLVSVEA